MTTTKFTLEFDVEHHGTSDQFLKRITSVARDSERFTDLMSRLFTDATRLPSVVEDIIVGNSTELGALRVLLAQAMVYVCGVNPAMPEMPVSQLLEDWDSAEIFVTTQGADQESYEHFAHALQEGHLAENAMEHKEAGSIPALNLYRQIYQHMRAAGIDALPQFVTHTKRADRWESVAVVPIGTKDVRMDNAIKLMRAVDYDILASGEIVAPTARMQAMNVGGYEDLGGLHLFAAQFMAALTVMQQMNQHGKAEFEAWRRDHPNATTL